MDIQVVGQGGARSFSSGGRVDGGRLRRTNANRGSPNRRRSGGASKKSGGDSRKKLTAEELDKELDDYMSKSAN